MKKINLACIITSGVLLQGCVGPVSGTYSANTLGKNKSSVTAGVTEPILPYAQYGYGIDDKTDVGVIIESDLFGAWFKRSIYNNPDKITWSGEMGLGTGFYEIQPNSGRRYIYVGTSIGHKFKWCEPLVNVRLNYVNYRHLQNTFFILKDPNLPEKYIHSHAFYPSVSIGNTFWYKGMGLNVGAHYTQIAELVHERPVYFSAGLVYEFN